MTNRYTTTYRSYNTRSRRYSLRKRVSLVYAEYQNGRKIPHRNSLRSYRHWVCRIPLSTSGNCPIGRLDFW